MLEVRVIQHKAAACRRLMAVAFDVVVLELLKEQAEAYDRQAIDFALHQRGTRTSRRA
jgi:hypothetical protein